MIARTFRYTSILVSLSLVLLAVASCHTASQDHNAELSSAYLDLYFVHFGLEYPPREEIVKICKEKQLPECLRVYNPVQKAKKFIIQRIEKDQEQTYRYTEKTITDTCQSKDDNVLRYCYGAITALYFFTDPIYDKKMQDLLAHASKEIVHVMLRTQFEWFYNRPNAEQWITLITALPNDILPDNEKQATLRFFREAKQPYEKFGVML